MDTDNVLRRLHLTVDDNERLSTHDVGALFRVYHWFFIVATHVLHDPQRVGLEEDLAMDAFGRILHLSSHSLSLSLSVTERREDKQAI